METVRLPIEIIGVADRLRPISPEHAEIAAGSLAETGQLRPIKVRKDGDHYFLVFGAHTLEGAARLGWTEIEAIVVEGMSAEEARLEEIDENLFRHDLNALDRAVFLAARKEIYERRHPETKKGAQGGRGGKKNETAVFAFSKDAAEKTGFKERTIQDCVRIATSIPAPLRKRLAGTPFAAKQGELLALAKADPAVQASIVDLVTREESPLPTIRAAVAFSEGRADKAAAGPDMLAKLQGNWNRASVKERRKFIAWLREQGEIA